MERSTEGGSRAVARCALRVGWCWRWAWAVRVAAAVALWAGADGLKAADNVPLDRVKAVADVLAADATGAEMVRFCSQRAPALAAAVRAAWLDWRIQQGVDDAHDEVERITHQRVIPDPAAQARVQAGMAQEGDPVAACTGLARHWGSAAEMDLRRRVPAAYDAQGLVVRLQPPREGEPPHQRRPAGTVWSVAQLCVWLDRLNARRGATDPWPPELTGRIHVQGRVEADGTENAYLEHDEGPFEARCRLSFGSMLRDNRMVVFDGHRLTLSATLHRPSSTGTVYGSLDHARVVPDASALTPSPLAWQTQLRRKPVDEARVRTAPGQGLAPGQVLGLLLDTTGIQPAEGLSRPANRMALLLKDGSVQFDPVVPPEDLDRKASQELQPQQWGRWRAAAGGGYEARRSNDMGQLVGDWAPLKGRLLSPWPERHALQGSYSIASFHGSLALGGLYFKSTLRFGADGHYESSQRSQGSSGGMAAAQGFAAGATHASNGQGSQSTFGGGGGGVTVTQQQHRDDGADRRGRYRVSGYVMELRLDSGEVRRVLSAPAREGGDSAIWFRDRVYTQESPAR